MNVGGLDDEKLSVLAQWAAGLRGDSRAEVAAAGRAIELLVDEVERLNVLLWAGPLGAVPTGAEAHVDEVAAAAGEDRDPEPAHSLRQRLQRRLAVTPRSTT